MKIFLCLFFSIILISFLHAQQNKDPVYVDKDGVMRWTKDKSEASFFGVNYTVPFAYGYRSHIALGIDPEKAIDADVHHMARLGLDAFRVHVWDVDITDSLGNIIKNDHLRLFDYLIKKLKEYNIKILITPIAFWGNGYPERDVRTNGFSYVYGKGLSVVKEEAFKAQENYLKQFFNHVNPYTKLKYKDDPDVIAMEINNEPHHSGPKERATEYINRMTVAVRSTGWTKPVFYNISESPRYADAIVKANVDGHSFQWYPTGLVANHERKGNFLPNVDQYNLPFSDTIPEFKNRALMVYEFDAGDVMQPIMYPAMARSYRTAGFQWATQFAYDPLYTAYGNTEYQTHYLNLVYTPAKAISLLIASKVFHKVPRNHSFGTYPSDTLFDVFRVSYGQQLAEMNSDEAFLYTGNTATQPKDVSRLKHIAGVGSSPVVKYEGTGAYFLKKIKEGIWTLEVMPDALPIKDPFERASPKKTVTHIQWNVNRISIDLPDLGNDFVITPICHEQGKTFTSGRVNNKTLDIRPGIYQLVSLKLRDQEVNMMASDFYAPPSSATETFVVHEPLNEITAGENVTINFTIAGIDTADRVSVELHNSSTQWKTIPMDRQSVYEYKAEIPADIIVSGIINYRIIIRKKNGHIFTFPGGFKGNPYAWDEWRNESWETFVSPAGNPLELFNVVADRQKIMLYNTDWRNNQVQYVASNLPGKLAIKTSMTKPIAAQSMGWQYYFRDKIAGRQNELNSFKKIVIKARSMEKVSAKVSLITTDASAFGSNVELTNEWQEIEIPLNNLIKSGYILLPRPYPGFLPLNFTSPSGRPLDITKIERLEVSFESSGTDPVSMEVEFVRLEN